MILIKTKADLKNILHLLSPGNEPVGFVPTMGALHEGHLSLVRSCKENNAICVCSIFVNPTQFNNKADFEKYPHTIEKDIDMLEAAGCDVLFLPSVAEMYPPGEPAEQYALGYLETILEGRYRPGHFQGVCRIVDKLLAAVMPGNLYMGSKDYQQCMVIKKLVSLKGYQTTVNIQPTVREASGLAMSSRNMRLSPEQRIKALEISKCLFYIKDAVRPGYQQDLLERMRQMLEAAGFKTDYVAIADAGTLEPVDNWDGATPLVALVAAYLDEIRLIDNILLKKNAN
jgi:pantoate--beta-alanine ligase